MDAAAKAHAAEAAKEAAEEQAKELEQQARRAERAAPKPRRGADPSTGNPVLDMLTSKQGQAIGKELVRGVFGMLKKRR